jgi:metallo-beta-lactamase class B
VGREDVRRDHPARHDLRLFSRGRSRRGLTTLGLDPATIKYAIVTHPAIPSHHGGARFLQERYKTRVLMSAADWNVIDRLNGTKPARDMVATDGQKLTLGDTTITNLRDRPVTRRARLSMVFTVKDKRYAAHRGVLGRKRPQRGPGFSREVRAV